MDLELSASAELCVVLPSHLASLKQVYLFEPRAMSLNVYRSVQHRHTDTSDIVTPIVISVHTHTHTHTHTQKLHTPSFLICSWWHLSGRFRTASVAQRDGFSHPPLLQHHPEFSVYLSRQDQMMRQMSICLLPGFQDVTA